VDDNDYLKNNHVLWLKVVPLKINIFAWRSFICEMHFYAKFGL